MTEAVYEAGSWIYKMFFLLLIIVVAIAIVGVGAQSKMNSAELQMDLMRTRILHDPNGIVFTDEHGTHPGIIDLAKFDQATIDTTLKYPEQYGGAKLTLIDAESGETLSTVTVNQATYTRIATNVAANLKNGGSTKRFIYPVVIAGERRQNGFLVIDLAGPAQA